MKYKSLIFICLIIGIFAVAGVTASDLNETDAAVMSIDVETDDVICQDESPDDLSAVEKNVSLQVSSDQDKLVSSESGPKGYIVSQDKEVTYKKPIEYKIQLVGEDIKNQEVSFSIDLLDDYGGRSTYDYYDTLTDSNGYATLRANLDEGRYLITTSTWDHGYAKNYLVVKVNGYRGLFITVDNTNNEIMYGWYGNFKGTLKIYKGSKIIKKIKIRSYGDFNRGYYSIKKFKDARYTAKIFNSKGKVVLKKNFVVSHKKVSYIEVKSFSIKSGKKCTVKARVSVDDKKVKRGTVKFKINGKGYKAKIKNGIAKITIKAPSKAKTYKCNAKYLGDKHNRKSSKTFKITVKKAKVIKKTPKKVKTKKSSKYIKFKGKSKYSWKIKKSTWKKMKRSAIQNYRFLHSRGSHLPGYSDFNVFVTATKGGYKYHGLYAFAVKNDWTIRCELRGLPNGERASTIGDY